MDVSRQYKDLALAVIELALIDAAKVSDARHIWQKDIDSAKAFLNNSPGLGFYADMAGIRHEMEKAGYLKPLEGVR